MVLPIPAGHVGFMWLAHPCPVQRTIRHSFDSIRSLDSKLFDAYNHCDLETLSAMVSDDLEFYHDQTGLSVGKAPFIAAIKQNIFAAKCTGHLFRTPWSVYPLKTYGAVEIGVHRFDHPGTHRTGSVKPSL